MGEALCSRLCSIEHWLLFQLPNAVSVERRDKEWPKSGGTVRGRLMAIGRRREGCCRPVVNPSRTVGPTNIASRQLADGWERYVNRVTKFMIHLPLFSLSPSLSLYLYSFPFTIRSSFIFLYLRLFVFFSIDEAYLSVFKG